MSRAPQHVPSPGQVHRALAQVRDAMALLQSDAGAADDTKLIRDTIEGETDAFEVLDALVEASVDAESLAKAARERAATLIERATRLDRRRAALRTMVLDMLQAMGLTLLERATHTVSVRQNSAELIVDEAALPDTYWRVTRAVDRALVRKHLDTGIDVPGARTGNASQSIMVRV